MAQQLTAALHLVLDDKISAGLKAMQKSLQGLRDAGKQIGLGQLTNGLQQLRQGASSADLVTRSIQAIGSAAVRAGTQIRRMAEDLAFAAKYHAVLGAQRLGGIIDRNTRPSFRDAREQIGVLGGVAAGYSVIEPVRKYAEQENILRHIAITEKLSGGQINPEVSRLNRNFNRDALETGQSSESIAKAYSDLVQIGIPANQLDRVITTHSRAATAYNMTPEALGPAVGALLQTFKVPEEELGSALSAMALAAKEGRFKVENFSQQLPGVAGSFVKAGMGGKAGATESFAALETLMKNTGEPAQAATQLNEIMSNIFSPFAERFFAKKGIDLGQMLRNAEKQGVNPLDAILGKLQQLIKGHSPVEQSQILGELIHDQTARAGLLALLQHAQEFKALQKQLDGAGPQTLTNDFNSAVAGPEVDVRRFDEQVAQLSRSIGHGFLPVLISVNQALGYLTDGFAVAEARWPGFTAGLQAGAGYAILFGGALGILGVVLPAIGAGLRLLFAPLRLVVQGLAWVVTGLAGVAGISVGAVLGIAAIAAVLAAAAIDIYENWRAFAGFFQGLWTGAVEIFRGAAEVIAGICTLDFGLIWNGLKDYWSGLGDFFGGQWGIVKQLFQDFLAFADAWTDGLGTRVVDGIKAAFSGLGSWFEGLWQGIEQGFEGFVQGIVSHLPSLPRIGPGPRTEPAAQGDGDGTPDTPGSPRTRVDISHTFDFKTGRVTTTTTTPDGKTTEKNAIDGGDVYGWN